MQTRSLVMLLWGACLMRWFCCDDQWWVVCNREIIARENTRHGKTAFQRIASRLDCCPNATWSICTTSMHTFSLWFSFCWWQKKWREISCKRNGGASRDQRDACIPFFAVRSVFFLYIYSEYTVWWKQKHYAYSNVLLVAMWVLGNMSWSLLIV